MGNRRKSRELAMQALFSMDMSQNGSKDILERFCDNFTPSSKTLSFFLKLVQYVICKILEEEQSNVNRSLHVTIQ